MKETSEKLLIKKVDLQTVKEDEAGKIEKITKVEDIQESENDDSNLDSSDSDTSLSSEEALSLAPSSKETRETLFNRVRTKIEVFLIF